MFCETRLNCVGRGNPRVGESRLKAGVCFALCLFVVAGAFACTCAPTRMPQHSNASVLSVPDGGFIKPLWSQPSCRGPRVCSD